MDETKAQRNVRLYGRKGRFIRCGKKNCWCMRDFRPKKGIV